MGAIGDEADPEFVSKMQHAVNDIVMAIEHGWTAVSEMGEHAQAVINGVLELIEARIAVSCRDDDALLAEVLDRGHVRIAFGCEGDDLDEPISGIEEALGVVRIGGNDSVRWVRPDPSGFRIEEGAFDMEPMDEALC